MTTSTASPSASATSPTSETLGAPARGTPRTRGKRTVSASLIAIYAVLIVVAAIWIIPVLFSVFTSFKSVEDFAMNAYSFLPAKWVTTNYMTLVESAESYPVFPWLKNSLIISIGHAVLSVVIVSLAGFGYSRLNFRGRDTLFFTLLLISLFPAVVNIIPQYRIVAALGWVNSYWAVIIPGLGNVANIFLVRNFMKTIPKELDEAAEIDGAGDFQIFRRIILPAIRPILIVIFLFSFTGAWNDFLWPTIVFNDIQKMPVTAGLQLLSSQMGQYNQMGTLMAATVLAIIPTLLLFLFAQRYFLQSLNINSGLK
jgi:multiple sugar transport system permease protein